MLLIIVFLPLINFLTFALFGTRVHRTQLANFTVASMGILLFLIAQMGPSVMEGNSYITTVGAWAVSGLFEIN